jgi:hypothetical protein
MKQTFSILLVAFLVSCASPDPMVTGKPQDWKGKASIDLRTALGEPTRIISQSNGDEVWEYRESADYTIPKGESIRAGLGSSPSGGTGLFSMEKRPEDRTSRQEQLFRFKIRQGKIIEWYAARFADGRKVWEDH